MAIFYSYSWTDYGNIIWPLLAKIEENPEPLFGSSREDLLIIYDSADDGNYLSEEPE